MFSTVMASSCSLGSARLCVAFQDFVGPIIKNRPTVNNTFEYEKSFPVVFIQLAKKIDHILWLVGWLVRFNGNSTVRVKRAWNV